MVGNCAHFILNFIVLCMFRYFNTIALFTYDKEAYYTPYRENALLCLTIKWSLPQRCTADKQFQQPLAKLTVRSPTPK